MSLPIPYCGLPPLPPEIWQRWLLDPVLLTGLAAVVGATSLAAVRSQGSKTQLGCLAAGASVLALSLISPLCALSVALFAARSTQHMLILVVAAPLVAVGLPAGLLRGLHRATHTGSPALAAVPALLFATLLWAWHVPALYEATFRSDLAYWAMHLSLFASALPLWVQLLQGGRLALSARVLAGFVTFVQMGLLGALLTLSPSVLYTSHLTTTQAWGLTPLMDQQLGGLIMWIPGCGAVLLALLWALQRALSPPPSHTPAR